MYKRFKISFFTVCMNRLHHLKQTLPKNIEDNLAYGNVEFVVLNYNSKDGLDKWIKKEMYLFIESGILNYFSTNEPQHFHASHSRNIAALCTKGEIICNLDADNFTGKNFAEYINKYFSENENIFLTTDKFNAKSDCFGRICVKKNDFLKINGYYEEMSTYGFQDEDLKNRLELIPLKKEIIKNQFFLNSLNHNDRERLKNNNTISKVKNIYIQHINHASFALLILFKNSKYLIGKVIKNRFRNSESIKNLFTENRLFEYDYSLQNDKWLKGWWSKGAGGLILKKLSIDFSYNATAYQNFKKSNTDILIKDFNFTAIEEHSERLHLTMFFSQITNRNKMQKNKAKKLVVVNQNYGRAKLIKNFKEKIELK